MNRNKIFKLADKKMVAGARKYGPWNPLKDERDLRKEATEELLDCINYCAMLIQKINKIKFK